VSHESTSASLTIKFIEKFSVPCVGGPLEGLGVVVEEPLPAEIEHEGGGRYVLEEHDPDDETPFVYVYES
jgi:hypothetical protein